MSTTAITWRATEPARIRLPSPIRDGLYRMELASTLIGIPLYRAHGFEPVEEIPVSLASRLIFICVLAEAAKQRDFSRDAMPSGRLYGRRVRDSPGQGGPMRTRFRPG